MRKNFGVSQITDCSIWVMMRSYVRYGIWLVQVSIYLKATTLFTRKLSPPILGSSRSTRKSRNLKIFISGSNRNMFIDLIQQEIIKPEECSHTITEYIVVEPA